MRRADAHLSHIIWALLVALPMVVASPPSAHAYTTESPEVKAMVNKALKYLEDQDELPRRLGGKSLIGLALVKGNRPKRSSQDPRGGSCLPKGSQEYSAASPARYPLRLRDCDHLSV